jgi:hypothetical protein
MTHIGPQLVTPAPPGYHDVIHTWVFQVRRVDKSQHGGSLTREVREGDSQMFTYGQKVTWQGQEVTYLGVVAGYDSLAAIQLANGQKKEVNKRGLTAPPQPADPIAHLPADVQGAIKAVRAVLEGPSCNTMASILRTSTRGPDQQGVGNNQKSATTGVLRRLVWGQRGGGVFGDTGTGATTIPLTTLAAAKAAHGDHFADNVRRTAEILRILR